MRNIDDILAKPISLWAISLVVAAGLWFYVLGTQDQSEKSRMIGTHIEYVNLAPQLEIKTPVREVWVEIYGAENDVDGLDNSKIICELDTRGLAAGKYRLPVRVVIPPEVRLREVRPSQVDIELIRYADRLVAVDVALPKDLPEGVYLDAVEVVPKEITIKGTEKDLARIGSVKISPTADELSSGKELLLPPEIESSEPFEEKVNFEPQQVRLKAVLVSGNPKRKIPVNARISGSPSGDYAVLSTTIDPSEIMVEGPITNLDRLKSIETETVDITGIEESKSMVVPIRPPQDKAIKIIGEQTVRVSVTLQPNSATKEIGNIPVVVEGALHPNWNVSPQFVTITLEGLPSAINGIDAASVDITAFVNAENLFSRQVTLPVRGRTSSDAFKIIKVEPATVSVAQGGE